MQTGIPLSRPRLRSVAVVAALALVSAGLFTACGSSSPVSPSEIQGGEWRLISLQRPESSILTIDDPSRYTLQFGTDSRFSARADCNRCSGSYTLSGSSLQMGPTACTLVGCPPDSLGDDYASALNGALTLSVEGGKLTLRGSRGTLRFTR